MEEEDSIRLSTPDKGVALGLHGLDDQIQVITDGLLLVVDRYDYADQVWLHRTPLSY